MTNKIKGTKVSGGSDNVLSVEMDKLEWLMKEIENETDEARKKKLEDLLLKLLGHENLL